MADQNQVVHCPFDNEESLYLAYMPFVKGGGLFVRTNQDYQLGDNLNLSVQLMDESDPFTVEGKVIWITPKGAQGGKPCGVGVQFVGENSRNLANKIETYLAGMLKSAQITDTI